MAHGPQEPVPIFDYPVISDGEPPNRPPKPGDQWTEDVWEEGPPPGSWKKKNNPIGTIEIHAKGPAGNPRFDASMTWKDHLLEVEGAVPGGDSWQGRGKAKAKGPKPDKDVDIEFKNPKRWG
jgi:hypothetical protein